MLLRISIRNDGKQEEMSNIFNLIQRKFLFRLNNKNILNSEKAIFEENEREKQR
jgi:hypothetical protein